MTRSKMGLITAGVSLLGSVVVGATLWATFASGKPYLWSIVVLNTTIWAFILRNMAFIAWNNGSIEAYNKVSSYGR